MLTSEKYLMEIMIKLNQRRNVNVLLVLMLSKIKVVVHSQQNKMRMIVYKSTTIKISKLKLSFKRRWVFQIQLVLQITEYQCTKKFIKSKKILQNHL
jgi:hypothetical protein